MEVNPKLISSHLSDIKHHTYKMTHIIWNISSILKGYPNDETIKSFCKHIVFSIQSCYLIVEETSNNVYSLYKELNKYIESKHGNKR